jgi:hypothetical protein
VNGDTPAAHSCTLAAATASARINRFRMVAAPFRGPLQWCNRGSLYSRAHRSGTMRRGTGHDGPRQRGLLLSSGAAPRSDRRRLNGPRLLTMRPDPDRCCV